MELLPTPQSTQAEGGMAPASLVLGLLAAGAGALAWAAIAYFTGYEVGYVAWALGGLVGLATVRSGGRGVTSAVVAAGLTIAGIAGGKLLGTGFVVEKELREGFEATFTPELHAELLQDAADFAQLPADAGDGALRQFMLDHRYTPADSVEGVEDEELQAFRVNNEPKLRALHENRTPYEAWHAECIAESRRAFEEDFSIVQANLDELNKIDLLFVLLGVTTAFGIVRRGDSRPTGTGGAVAPAADEDVRKAA